MAPTPGWSRRRGWRRSRRPVPLSLVVNGRPHSVDVDPSTPLLYVLSDDLRLRGPKFGCGLGQCGACTVIVRGQAIRSCVTPVRLMAGAEITTLEGLGSPEKPHPIQQAFIDEQAAQCGFCLNAVIMTAKAFLDQHPTASDEEIRSAFANVLCRCFTHTRLMKAIDRYRRGLGGPAAGDQARGR
ncbi:MAG: (2Fe-2S)-binding protein [Acidobacteriota bacterium]|nr:(2Fe-2S)-binding protein [Acidobacteriota bacterium]